MTTTHELDPAAPRRLLASVLPTSDEIASARRRLHAKALFIVVLDVVAYSALVFAPLPWWGRVIAAAVLVHALVATATGIMHDANHGAFARRRRVNQALSYTADLLGASSLLWRFQHNDLHHRHTNVEGVDTDIDQAPFARLSPSQPWKPRHRFQHVYMWPLYGFLTLQWFVASDYLSLHNGGMGSTSFRTKPTRGQLARLFTGKAVHLTWALVVPMLFHPVWMVLVTYVVCSWCVGFALAMIFQVAHCVTAADFVAEDRPLRGDDLVRHQLDTTVDVALPGRLSGAYLGFLAGGLEYQVEHHLAPRLPHTYYRVMAKRVSAMCAANGLVHRVHTSPSAALASHVAWLRMMGRPPRPRAAVVGPSSTGAAARRAA